jgi:hypothetical protein
MPMHLARSIAAFALTSLALVAVTVPALAQQPSDEQIAAIRAACRSDFMSHCSGVPRGGAEALACLKRNVAQLSLACQAAVNAVAAAAPAKPAPAAAPAAPAAPPPAPAAAAPAPAPAAPAPTAAPAPSGPAASAPATAAPAAPPKKNAAVPPKAPPPVAAAPVAPPPAVAPQTALGPIPPLSPRARLMILRACGAEQQALCANVPPGGGRIVECLAAHGASLSAGCRGAILSAR